MKIVITGGAGFLGRRLSTYPVTAGYTRWPQWHRGAH